MAAMCFGNVNFDNITFGYTASGIAACSALSGWSSAGPAAAELSSLGAPIDDPVLLLRTVCRQIGIADYTVVIKRPSQPRYRPFNG